MSGETPITNFVPDYVRGEDRILIKQGAEARVYTTTLLVKPRKTFTKPTSPTPLRTGDDVTTSSGDAQEQTTPTTTTDSATTTTTTQPPQETTSQTTDSTTNIDLPIAAVAKERFSKKYRIPELDQKLRKKQIKNEIKALDLCKNNNIPAPIVLDVDNDNYIIYTTLVEGITVRDYIHNLGDLTAPENQHKVEQLGQKIGHTIAQLHSNSLIHGDLTTSNFMVNVDNTPGRAQSEQEMVLYSIDFGLSQISDNVEEKAVDLYVLERAIDTTHNQSQHLIHVILAQYTQYLDAVAAADQAIVETPTPQPPAEDDTTSSAPTAGKNEKKKQQKVKKMRGKVTGTQVIARLREVRARGRKKSMIG